MANTVVVDVRSDKEWTVRHIEGCAAHHAWDLQKHIDGLPRDRPLITVCGSDYRSNIAASLLSNAGFAKISSTDGA